jgi:hypothetical protein
MKYSRDLIDLRDREQKLVKVKRYEEAEKVKMKADLLEEFERNKLEAEVSRRLVFIEVLGFGSCPEKRAEVASYTVVVVGRTTQEDLAR